MPKIKPDPDVKHKKGERERKPWSLAEEKVFDQIVNHYVKENIWNWMKDDPTLALRRSNGIKAHWGSKFKKWTGK